MMIETPEQVADRIRKVTRRRARRARLPDDRLRHEAAAAHGREDEAARRSPRARRSSARRCRDGTERRDMSRAEDHRGRRRDRRAGRRPGSRHPGRPERRVRRCGRSRATRTRTRRRRSPRWAPRSSPADLDDEASLSDGVRRARTAPSASPSSGSTSRRRRRWPQARPWPRRRRTRASSTSIWSTLEDTRKWVPLDDDRMPTLQGKYKVPHFDAKGEANHFFTDARRADDLPAHVVLLGQLHLLRHGAEEGRRTASWPHAADGRQEARRASRPRTSASAPTASSRRGDAYIGKTVGIAGEHLTGAQMAAALSQGARRRRCATTT